MNELLKISNSIPDDDVGDIAALCLSASFRGADNNIVNNIMTLFRQLY